MSGKLEYVPGHLISPEARADLRVKLTEISPSDDGQEMQSQATRLGLHIDWLRDPNVRVGILRWRHIQIGLLFLRRMEALKVGDLTLISGLPTKSEDAWVVVDLLADGGSEDGTVQRLGDKIKRLKLELQLAVATVNRLKSDFK